MKIVVIGSGIAGCLAANFFKAEEVVVVEKSPKINFNSSHNAVMRMGDQRIGLILGSRLKKIEVKKEFYWDGVIYKDPPISAKNSYSLKVSGIIQERSIKRPSGGRYLFDEDKNYLKGIRRHFSSEVIKIEDKFLELKDLVSSRIYREEYDVCISTIPLFSLGKIIGWEEFDVFFDLRRVYTCVFDIGKSFPVSSEVNQTIYVSDICFDMYRATLQGCKMIFEFVGLEEEKENKEREGKWGKEIIEIMALFGIPNPILYFDPDEFEFKRNSQGKISKIDEGKRKGILSSITEEYNLYSLGRYATWKPQLMVEDLVQDLERIREMIKIGEKRRKYESKINKCNS